MDKTALFVPVVAEQLRGVRSADGAVAATHFVSRAIFVTTPADPLRMLGMEWKSGRFYWFLVHRSLPVECRPSHAYLMSGFLRTTCDFRHATPITNYLFASLSTG